MKKSQSIESASTASTTKTSLPYLLVTRFHELFRKFATSANEQVVPQLKYVRKRAPKNKTVLPLHSSHRIDRFIGNLYCESCVYLTQAVYMGPGTAYMGSGEGHGTRDPPLHSTAPVVHSYPRGCPPQHRSLHSTRGTQLVHRQWYTAGTLCNSYPRGVLASCPAPVELPCVGHCGMI